MKKTKQNKTNIKTAKAIIKKKYFCTLSLSAFSNDTSRPLHICLIN